MQIEEYEDIAAALQSLEPGFLPYPIFVQITRLTTMSIIEFVPLRMNAQGQVEVLLLERGDDDPIWPGELHTPGTVIRPTDNEGDFYGAFKRIVDDELQGTSLSDPQYVGSQFHKSKRGSENAQIYWVEVLGEPSVGTFYSVESLPEKFMSSQEKFVKLAAEKFKEYKKNAS